MDNSNNLDELMRQLNELKQLRASMDDSTKNISKKERISSINNKEEKIKNSNDLIEMLKKQINDLDKEINEVETELKETAKEYEEKYKSFQEIIDEEDKKLDSNSLLDDEQIKRIREYYEILKTKENKRSLEIKNAYDIQKRLLIALKGKKTKLKNDIEKAEALNLSIEDYNEINSALRKTKIFEAILDRKGLKDIISKKATERTKEEKQLLKETKEEIMKEISELKNEKTNSNVLDIIQALYGLNITYEKVKPKVVYMSINEFEKLKENVSKLPVVYVGDKYDDSKQAFKAPKDLENIKENKEDVDVNSKIDERIVIFKDKDNGDLYIREYTRDKFKDVFDINEEEKGIKIKGSLCFKINQMQANYIIDNANNKLSPYVTKIDEIELDKKEYNADYYNITNEEFELLKEKGLTPGTEEFLSAIEEKKALIDEFKNDVEEVAYDEVVKTLSYPKEEDSVFINKQENHNSYEKDNSVFIKEEKEDDKTVTSLMEDLTEGLDINEIDVERYIASNIQVTKEFREELKEGKTSYNIIHIGGAIIKAPINLLKKISSTLLLSYRGKQMMEKVSIRLDKLTDTELELLCDLEKDNPVYPLVKAKLEERKNSDFIEENYEIVDMFEDSAEEEKDEIIRQR